MVTYEQFWYGYPPWSVFEPPRVFSIVSSFQYETGVAPVQPICHAQSLKNWNAGDGDIPQFYTRTTRTNLKEQEVSRHLGQNIDQYV